MSKDKKKSSLGKFLLGLGVGAGLGVLFAPKKGSETRKDLKCKLDELVEKIKNVDVEEMKEQFQNKVEEIKELMDDLDKEKVLKIAKEKGEQLKEKAEELVCLAKEKGTPILEKTAKEVKAQAANVVREVLKKLES